MQQPKPRQGSTDENGVTPVERVWRGDRVRFRNPDNQKVFTIQSKELLGVRFFGAVPDGRTRAANNRYLLLDRHELENWLDGLELVQVVSEFDRVSCR